MPTVAIIGSYHEDRYQLQFDAIAEFEECGITVIHPSGAPVDELTRNTRFVRFESDERNWSDAKIETRALNRILRADAVWVCDPDGYIGANTALEIGHARQANKPIYFRERPHALSIEVMKGFIATPRQLAYILSHGEQKPLHEYMQGDHGEWERDLLEGNPLFEL